MDQIDLIAIDADTTAAERQDFEWGTSLWIKKWYLYGGTNDDGRADLANLYHRRLGQNDLLY